MLKHITLALSILAAPVMAQETQPKPTVDYFIVLSFPAGNEVFKAKFVNLAGCLSEVKRHTDRAIGMAGGMCMTADEYLSEAMRLGPITFSPTFSQQGNTGGPKYDGQ